MTDAGSVTVEAIAPASGAGASVPIALAYKHNRLTSIFRHSLSSVYSLAACRSKVCALSSNEGIGFSEAVPSLEPRTGAAVRMGHDWRSYHVEESWKEN